MYHNAEQFSMGGGPIYIYARTKMILHVFPPMWPKLYTRSEVKHKIYFMQLYAKSVEDQRLAKQSGNQL